MKNRMLIKAIAVIAAVILIFAEAPVQYVKASSIVQISQATQTVNEMGIGWNLGNTLDSYSDNLKAPEIAIQKRDQYQIMATYSTKNYSGWDASNCPYFSVKSSSCELNWNITKLNSALSQSSGFFGFQIINNTLENTGEDALKFTVTKAQFTTASGNVINLSDMAGTYSKVISNKVTAYVKADLTKVHQLAKASDLIGGKLTITVKINEYPTPQTAPVTKEVNYETLSGNPVTTKAMIDQVKAAGFGAIRIPVTYSGHMDEDGNIDKAWLKRIAAIVQYCLDDGLYCIINMHHDTGTVGWLHADGSDFAANTKKFQSAWEQISSYFKKYSNKLLFEGFNELLNMNGQWSNADNASYDGANLLNQIFVDAVRSTGGNNSTRSLIVNTYAANGEQSVIDGFQLPKDSAYSSLIVGVHYYGTSQDGISALLNRLNTKFVSAGVPVIIAEFGSTFKTELESRIKSAEKMVKDAKAMGITCFWWDDGNYTNKAGAQSNFGLLDRYALTWYHPSLVTALITASK